MAAKVEEVVVTADAGLLAEMQYLLPDPRHRFFNFAFRGNVVLALVGAVSGAGSALRSSLPLGVSGSDSSRTKALGTMYSGSSVLSCVRSSSMLGSSPSLAVR